METKQNNQNLIELRDKILKAHKALDEVNELLQFLYKNIQEMIGE